MKLEYTRQQKFVIKNFVLINSCWLLTRVTYERIFDSENIHASIPPPDDRDASVSTSIRNTFFLSSQTISFIVKAINFTGELIQIYRARSQLFGARFFFMHYMQYFLR